MKALKIIPTVALVALAGLVPVRAQDKEAKDVDAAIANFKSSDAGVAKWFDTSYGYAVFPSVGKGAVVVGGASGSGRVFEKHAYIGDAHLTQATVGAQIGGESFSEVIFFETKAALDRFKENKFEMSAGLSAVAANSGKSEDAKYADGVAVFTLAKKGLMAEASVGGQKFKFTPKK
jgi:lipid-binding SYLF domain-containing protein